MATAIAQPKLTSAQRRIQYIKDGHAAGVPREMMAMFRSLGYVAQGKQLQFHAACARADQESHPALIGFGGARGPGKTHASFIQLVVDSLRHAGLKSLFLRKIGRAGAEAFEDLRRRVLGGLPHHFNNVSGVMEFPNGSRIFLGHFKDEKDIDKYLGIEYDLMAIEEATQLSAMKIKKIRGSLRTSKPNWRPRLYATTNPGGIGHQWFRKMFVLPWRKHQQTDTIFIPATIDDNKFVNRDYRTYLKELDGALGKMWRDGDWDVAGGAYFSNWSYDHHVRPDIEILPHWRCWLSMDYGWNHPTVVHLFTKDEDGNVLVVDEWAGRQTLIADQYDAIKAMLARHNVRKDQLVKWVAGHDVFAKKDEHGSIAQRWLQDYQVRLEKANIDRIGGAQHWLERLGRPADPEKPRMPSIQISDRCSLLIETIPMLLSDPSRPEDVLKVDIDPDGEGGDDAYDCARYGLQVVKPPTRAYAVAA